MAIAVPPKTPTSYPWFHGEYAPRAKVLRAQVIKSGCSTSGGNVQCDPSAMAAKAGVSLPVYTMARYMTSEVGGGTVEEMVAVGEAAVNQARLRGYPDINKLLLYNPGTKDANRGYYGPIHGPSGVSTAPYSRWAATSKDPHALALELADLVISGKSGDFSDNATSQYGLEHLSNPTGKVLEHAADNKFWVGPLPGVDHWRTFLFRAYPKGSLSAPEKQALLERGLWGVKQPRPSWPSNMPVAARVGVGFLSLAVAGVAGYYLWKSYR